MVKTKRTKLSLLIVAAALTAGVAIPYVQNVRADSLQNQINQLQAENNSNNQTVADLANSATSYQDAITRLQSQISIVQGQISDNQATQASLNDQITANEAEITKDKGILGDNLKQLYVDGQMTSMEMLATSKNLSDYVDKEEYRTIIQNKISNTLQQIQALQVKLADQKKQVEELLKEQESSRSQLAAARQQQADLLNYNQSQQAAYNAKTKANDAKISALIQQQRLANTSSKNGAAMAGATSYPYANWGFSMSTAPGCNDNDGPDAWGYCTRQCVSYAAWAVAHSGRSAPQYYGSAYQWPSRALARGVPVYSWTNVEGYAGVRTGGPQPGDVAISTAGEWGHAMYVENVSGSQIYVSQYNQALNGEFSYQWRDASDYYFIRF